jgi:hypothetical protein
LHEDRTRGPGETALIVEACRLVDRLDLLNAALRGDAWMHLAEGKGARLVVVVDAAASEARLTAGALKGLIAELRLHEVPGVTRGGAVPTGESPPPKLEVDEVDELRARRGAAGRVPDSAG